MFKTTAEKHLERLYGAALRVLNATRDERNKMLLNLTDEMDAIGKEREAERKRLAKGGGPNLDNIERTWNVRERNNRVQIVLSERPDHGLFYVSVSDLIDDHWTHRKGSTVACGGDIDKAEETVNRFYIAEANRKDALPAKAAKESERPREEQDAFYWTVWGAAYASARMKDLLHQTRCTPQAARSHAEYVAREALRVFKGQPPEY